MYGAPITTHLEMAHGKQKERNMQPLNRQVDLILQAQRLKNQSWRDSPDAVQFISIMAWTIGCVAFGIFAGIMYVKEMGI